MFRDDDNADPVFTDSIALDLGDVEPSIAGPKRPQDRVPLTAPQAPSPRRSTRNMAGGREESASSAGRNFDLGHGDVAIAMSSCTNTSNPCVMVAAGMLARNAVKRGLQVKPWVKTSLAPDPRW